MHWIAVYFRGFLFGMIWGVAFLAIVYWAAQQFPGDPKLNRYYLYLRGMENEKIN